ncbi:MAG TPA: hypothetical protein DEG47_26460, partial [Cyanobacteria bacterium UBA11148]|nr:hypothetical protein [Cyanobacteria bacterium UBA11148]
MSYQEPIRKKNSSQFNQTPASNPLQPRRRQLPKPPQEVVQLSPEQQKALLEEQQLKASRFGYNGLEVPVDAPATPESPIQKQSASTGLENEQQPQVVPEVNEASETVEETVESAELSGDEA